MYKILLILVFVSSLYAKMVDGVAVVVKGEAITLYDIKKEMSMSHVDAKQASDVLIRKKLEDYEIKQRNISVTPSEVYDDIKKTAERNNMSVSQFYDAIRESNGLSSHELKEKIKEKILAQKLYSAIAYSSVSEPNDDEIKEYYNLHKEKFMHPSSFSVMIYASASKEELQKKVSNPMYYSQQVHMNEQVLPYDKISPELASLLAQTQVNSFTPIVPNGPNGFMSFYIKEVTSGKDTGYEGVKNQIVNMLMEEKREQVLGDYFARLRSNAEIKILRMPE